MYVYVLGQSRRHDAMARCGWRVMRRKCCRELHRGVRHHLALHSPRSGNKSRWFRSTGVLAVDPDCMLMPRIESRPTQRLLTLKSLFINVQVILLTPTLAVCRTQINWITGKGIFVPITVTACGNYAEEEYERREDVHRENVRLVRSRNFSTTRSLVPAIITRWLTYYATASFIFQRTVFFMRFTRFVSIATISCKFRAKALFGDTKF